MRQFLLLLVVVATAATANAAPPTTANTIIRDFAREIYVMAEHDGGDPAQWDVAQNKALAALIDSANSDPETLATVDGKGRTPLMNAAINGYHFMVTALLAHASVRATIDTADAQNLTAYAHSQLALKRTLYACHPVVENPFILVPIIVTQPYYDAHPPYAATGQSLLDAGAGKDLAIARAHWLAKCTNARDSTRQAVEITPDLLTTLVTIATEEARATRLKEIKKNRGHDPRYL